MSVTHCQHGKPNGTYCSICSWIPLTVTTGWEGLYQWPPLIPEPEPGTDRVSVKQGWECPKCERVFSPAVHQCMYCPEKVTSETTGTANAES